MDIKFTTRYYSLGLNIKQFIIGITDISIKKIIIILRIFDEKKKDGRVIISKNGYLFQIKNKNVKRKNVKILWR